MKSSTLFLAAFFLVPSLYAQDSLAPLTVVGSIGEETGFDSDDIELLQIMRTNDLVGLTPALSAFSTDSAGYGDFLAVRGTGNTTFFGPAGVGLMVDDVPFSDVFGYSDNYFDLAALELHRGPQGAFFSRNGAGGLLNLRTLGLEDGAPNQFSISTGDDHELGLRLRYSQRVSETVGLSFQTYFNERDGYLDNLVFGGDVDDRQRFGFLGNIDLAPSGDAKMKIRILYEQVRDGAQRLSPLSLSPAYAGNPFRVSSNPVGVTELDRTQLSFHYERNLGWADFKSITAFQHWDLGPQVVDLDFSPFEVADSSIDQAQNYWSQDFRLSSSGDFSFTWNTGLFLSYKEGDGAALRGLPVDERDPSMGQFFQTTIFDREEKSFAFYGNVTQELSERIAVTAGARLEYVDTELNRNKIGAFVPNPDFGGSVDDWYFSPSLGLTYEAWDAVTLFARSSIGVKPAGFTAFTDNPATLAFEDETAWENEIGLRYSQEDVTFEIRGYHKEIDDYQLNRSDPASTDFTIVNVDNVSALGLEAEITWQPIGELSLYANAGWNETTFDSGAKQGEQIPFVPELTASAGFHYNFGNGFFLTAAARFVGETYYGDNDRVSLSFEEGNYQVVDAQLGYQTDDWSLVLYGRNILDEDYYQYQNPQIFAGTPGDPAVVGVRYERRF